MGWKVESLKRSLDKAQKLLDDKSYREAEDVARVLKKDCYMTSFWRGLAEDERKVISDIGHKADDIVTQAARMDKQARLGG